MAVTRVGSIQSGGAASQTSWATSFPQAPTAGNLLLLTISRGRTGAAATLGGLSGWTLMGSGAGSRSTQSINCDLYARIATGGDAAPTVTASASSNLQWNLEEWSGLSTTLPTAGIPNTWTMQNASGGGGVVVSDTEVADVDNEWVFAVLAGRGGSGGNPSFTWDSDLTANQNTASGSNRYLFTATGTIASSGGSLVASFTVVNGQGDGMDCLGMVGFAPAPVAPPQGSASGSYTYTGSATGRADHAGTASGTHSWAGSATGASNHHGSVSGSWNYAGSASGATDYSGSASSSWNFSGSAAGQTQRRGSALGSWDVAGTASGESHPQGSASGAHSWTSSAAGSTDHKGTASGNWHYVGTATGTSDDVPTHAGTASASWQVTGAATGSTGRRGTASGSHGWTGSATGEAVYQGFIAGTHGWTTSASGLAYRSGSATSTYTWVCNATGQSDEIEIPRDPRATITRRTRKATITKRTATATITHTSEKAVIP